MSATIIAFPSDRVRRPATPANPPAATPWPADGDTGRLYTDLEVATWCKEVGWPYLTANQRDFISTICLSLPHQPLTCRQAEWLEGIVARLNRRLFPGGGDAA